MNRIASFSEEMEVTVTAAVYQGMENGKVVLKKILKLIEVSSIWATARDLDQTKMASMELKNAINVERANKEYLLGL